MDGTQTIQLASTSRTERRPDRSPVTRAMTVVFAICLGTLVSTQSGCSFIAQAIHAAKGSVVKAEYTGLEEKRVAVVCVSAGSAYGPDNSTELITNAIRMKLVQEDLDIDLVRASEVDQWLDGNWEDIDYAEIGRAVKADRVVAVDLGNYSLYEGSTMYKGRTSYTVSIFDMEKGGNRVFSRGPNDFEFPRTHGTPTTSYSERQFESYYVHELASDIVKYFYDYDFPETVARDAAHFGQ